MMGLGIVGLEIIGLLSYYYFGLFYGIIGDELNLDA